jgi:hypothetical protein
MCRHGRAMAQVVNRRPVSALTHFELNCDSAHLTAVSKVL